MNLKGLATNLKLPTNKITWIHWSLDLVPLSKMGLSFFLKLFDSQDVLIVKIPLVFSDATHTASMTKSLL
jgi:hypothetical protein